MVLAPKIIWLDFQHTLDELIAWHAVTNPEIFEHPTLGKNPTTAIPDDLPQDSQGIGPLCLDQSPIKIKKKQGTLSQGSEYELTVDDGQNYTSLVADKELKRQFKTKRRLNRILLQIRRLFASHLS